MDVLPGHGNVLGPRCEELQELPGEEKGNAYMHVFVSA